MEGKLCENNLAHTVFHDFLELRKVKRDVLDDDIDTNIEMQQQISKCDEELQLANPQDSLPQYWGDKREALDGILYHSIDFLRWRDQAVIDIINVIDPSRYV